MVFLRHVSSLTESMEALLVYCDDLDRRDDFLEKSLDNVLDFDVMENVLDPKELSLLSDATEDSRLNLSM